MSEETVEWLTCFRCAKPTDVTINNLCETCWRRDNMYVVPMRPESWWEHLWPFRRWRLKR